LAIQIQDFINKIESFGYSNCRIARPTEYAGALDELKSHVFPGYQAPVILGAENSRELVICTMVFGLQARINIKNRNGEWESKVRRFHNARCETIGEKKSFRDSFALRRCIVPLTSFYEYREKERIEFGVDGYTPIFAAGIWSSGPESTEDTFSIITTEPPIAILNAGHDRCPLMLSPLAWHDWLAPGALKKETFQRLIHESDNRGIRELTDYTASQN
jgi:putative SOS response-associated peptidase YedK